MAVTLRLMRLGKKNQPFYRIVVTEKTRKRNGKYLEKIGIYNPLDNEPVRIDDKKLKYWINKGAQVSKGLKKLLKTQKFIRW